MKRTEDALRQVALAVFGAEAAEVFQQLVHSLATILEVDIPMLALPMDTDPVHMRTLAVWMDGEVVDEFEYPLAGVPFETAINCEFCCFGHDRTRTNLQVVLITGYGDGIDPRLTEQAGIASVLHKPLEPATPLAVIRPFLAGG